MSNEKKKGYWQHFFAYVIWGAFPLYWKMLEHVPSMEILLGRVIWSFVFTVIAVVLIGMRKELLADLKYLWTHQKLFLATSGSFFCHFNELVFIYLGCNA